jgi:hypothetical protein
MAEQVSTLIRDPSALRNAGQALHGYFLYNRYMRFLDVIGRNLCRWESRHLLRADGFPNSSFERLLFDFEMLDLDRLADICGTYFYLYARHKKANHRLLQKTSKKRVLHLRGFDYEASVSIGGGTAVGISTGASMMFSYRLGKLLEQDFEAFMALSPKDLERDSAPASTYYMGHYSKVIQACNGLIPALFLHAHHWKEDVAHLVDRMDYFVVYVSSITESVLWELNYLREHGCADRTTVVLDREEILNKGSHSYLHSILPKDFAGHVRWRESKRVSNHKDVEALYAELAESFDVVMADSFDKSAEVLKERISKANGPLGPGDRETFLDLRFYPALDDAAIRPLQDLDAALWKEVDPEGSAEISCLPFYLNQVQLRIYTALLFGAIEEAGRTLATHAGVVAAVLDYSTTADQTADQILVRSFPDYEMYLKDHRGLAETVAWHFLSMGNSHDFGDHTQVAKSTLERTLVAARHRVARFLEDAASKS